MVRLLALAAILLATVVPLPASAAGPQEAAAQGHPGGAVALGGPSADEWENGLSDEFAALLQRTGVLGTFIRDDEIVVVVPTSGSGSFSAKDAAELGIDVVVEERDIELSDIRDIEQMVKERNWRPLNPGVVEPVALFNARDGRVRIYTDAPVGEFQSVIDRFSTKVDFVGWSYVDYSRLNDVEPHWGGARIRSSSTPSTYWCTSGFSVNNASLKPRMVTAGHCWPDGADVYSPQGTSFGEVMNRSQYPNPIDAELVGAQGIGMGPSIYVGGQTGQRADVYSGISVGTYIQAYCHSGARTYENCGAQTIYASDFNVNGSWVRNFEYPPGLGPCNGDSGAPVYRYYFDDVMIAGIIKGGANFDDPGLGGDGDGFLDSGELATCHAESNEAWVTTWIRIRDAYDVTIKTI